VLLHAAGLTQALSACLVKALPEINVGQLCSEQLAANIFGETLYC
jgi:hypothetical protein